MEASGQLQHDAFTRLPVTTLLESIDTSGAMRNSARMPACRRPPRSPARKGLAAWQQVVIAGYVEKHISENITIRSLARFVYLSPDSFSRAFKRSFGMPPQRYVMQRRIERAKRLLASSKWSIAAISAALGFRQRSSFSLAFQHATGTSPTEYRRTQQ